MRMSGRWVKRNSRLSFRREWRRGLLIADPHWPLVRFFRYWRSEFGIATLVVSVRRVRLGDLAIRQACKVRVFSTFSLSQLKPAFMLSCGRGNLAKNTANDKRCPM